MVAGFEGGFLSYPLDTKSESVDMASQPQPPRSRKSTIPWPVYERVHKGGLIYPPQLQATYPLQFTLTLPNPAILPLHRFLKTVNNTLPNVLQEFISILYLWTRSLQMNEFTPTCLALIAIRFIQARLFWPLVAPCVYSIFLGESRTT